MSEELKRLTKIEQEQLQARKNIIDSKTFELSMLQSEQKLFVESLMTSKGLDASKAYSVGVDGELIEAETDKVAEEKKEPVVAEGAEDAK